MTMQKRLTALGLLSIIFVFFLAYDFLGKLAIANYPSAGTDIIAFGDSLVEGVGSTEGNNFVSLLSKRIEKPIINLGRAGDSTYDGIQRINQLNKYNPKIVFVLFGGNDHLRKIPVEETRKNLATIIENIQARGAIVFLLGVRGGLISDGYDSEFEDLQSIYQTAFVPDVLDGLFGNLKYMSDAVHPNNLGYEKIAERIYPILVKVLK